MGAFLTETEIGRYFGLFCAHCIHGGDRASTQECTVWDVHMTYPLREVDDPRSILHVLIPRDEQGNNLQCRLFVPRPEPAPPPPPPPDKSEVREELDVLTNRPLDT
jgi:hypothetical protein